MRQGTFVNADGQISRNMYEETQSHFVAASQWLSFAAYGQNESCAI